MVRYIEWRTASGLPFDPWLRAHARLGAGIVEVCATSMEIPGTVAEWEGWTGMQFPETGTYVVPGALQPIEIDVESGEDGANEPFVAFEARSFFKIVVTVIESACGFCDNFFKFTGFEHGVCIKWCVD
jgi:hypothetical protein